MSERAIGFGRRARGCRAAGAAALALAAGLAQAAPPPRTGLSLGAFAGQGVHNDFANIIPDTVTGKLDGAESYVGAGIIRYELPTPEWIPGQHQWGAKPVTTSVEFAFYGYRGLGRNSAVSLDWRPSINFAQLGSTSFDFAWGFGVWQSIGTPWYNHEGSQDDNQKYKTLLHMTPEVVVRSQMLPNWSLGFRINHVSGVYGLIAPSSLGTNHLGMTLMRAF